jgi:uncharacterized coiled-coil DUF342 family protein
MEERIKELENKVDFLLNYIKESHKIQSAFNDEIQILTNQLNEGDTILKNNLVEALNLISKLEAEINELKNK